MKKGGVKKGIDAEDARRRREDHAVRIRKEKAAEQIAKHRKVRGGGMGRAAATRLTVLCCCSCDAADCDGACCTE